MEKILSISEVVDIIGRINESDGLELMACGYDYGLRPVYVKDNALIYSYENIDINEPRNKFIQTGTNSFTLYNPPGVVRGIFYAIKKVDFDSV